MKTFAEHFFINSKGIQTHGIKFGNSQKKLFFLHGWGGNINGSFFELALNLKKSNPDLEIILLDLPGFGLSQDPSKEGWKTFDYADWFKETLDSLLKKETPKNNIYFYGHSFGCRVIVRFLNKYSEFNGKTILTSAAGIKCPLSFRQKISVFLSKKFKRAKASLPQKIQKFILCKIFGARDWGNVKPELKTTLEKVLNEKDFRNILPNIKNNILLIWGNKDTVTPISSGKIYKQQLPNTNLEILKNGRHGIHYTHQKEIMKLITKFLRKHG
ncbi:alpha/beta hydrolase [Candidatus Gracilibacteria bacterium]|nr:alpha/beta hydrolase [Candidatus Gracilibacteria bacterium]